MCVVIEYSCIKIIVSYVATVEQAQEKWRELCKYYVEGSALRSCEYNSGLEVEAMDKSSYDELYDRLHKIHETVIKTTTCSNSDQMKHSKAAVNIANKKFFKKCIKKAKLSAKEFKEQLMTVAVVASTETNLNSNVGELIETELQDMSQSTSGRKRTEILKLLTELNN